MLVRIFQLWVLFFLILSHLSAQTIKGVVIDKKSKIPLIGAHIYIINSLQGTVSDADGKFTLTLPNTHGEILVTYVGYENRKIEFLPSSKNLTISLTVLANQLREVPVHSTVDKKWKRLYKKFENSFLGSTKNAGFCVIINPWVVEVTKGPNGEILASSKQPIEIINNVLGYKLTFHLAAFTLKADRLHYQGFVYFDELEPFSSAQTKKWKENRRETYLGSKRHFIQSLNKQKLDGAGFEVYEAEFNPGLGFTTSSRKRESELLKTAYELSVPDYLKIVYTKAQPQRAYFSNRQSQQSVSFQGPKADLVPKGDLQMSTQSTNNQVSYLYSRNSKLTFTDTGYIVNNKHIIEYGYWSWLGVAEMLPFEYQLEVD